MEPEVFDAKEGKIVVTYQTFVVRTPKYTILVDTCTGEDKGHPAPFDFPGKERWRNELFALGVSYEQIDYVFCTHLHIDHTGWNTTLRDGRWVPTFPKAKYVFSDRELAYWTEVVGKDEAFAISLAVGISVIYAGFLVASSKRAARGAPAEDERSATAAP